MARTPLFLERRSYRHRRLMDAVRLLPFVGLALWMLPLLWSGAAPQGVPETAQGAPMRSSTALLFVFGVWCVLITVGFVLTRKTQGSGTTASGTEGRGTHRPGTEGIGPADRPDPAASDAP